MTARKPLAIVAIFFVGGIYLGSLSSFTTVAQLRAPAELRGRVVSVLMMLIGALYPIGSIAQGAIADEIGLRATTTGAAVLLGALLLTWRLLRPRAADAIGDTITTAAAFGGPDAVIAPVTVPDPGSEPAV
jgi:predicted MFS family arabinose efflux permease